MTEPGASPPPLRARIAVHLLHALWIGLGLVFAVRGKAEHDYQYYIAQWRLVLDGADPWAPIAGSNAYGPLHNLLALLLPLGDVVPKFAIIGVFAVASGLLLDRLMAERWRDWKTALIFALALPANFLITLFAFRYGSNDLLVGAFTILAMLSRIDRKDVAAGAWLALAVLLKFYPIVFLPLLMLDGRKIRWQIGLVAVLVVGAGLALAYAVWGEAIWSPLVTARDRGPSFLSALRLLSDHGVGIVQRLITHNMLVVLGVFVLSLAFVRWRGYSWLVGLVLVTLPVLMAYKVGHEQLFIPWVCAVACLPLLRSPEADRAAFAAIPVMVFLSLLAFVHVRVEHLIYDNLDAWSVLALIAQSETLLGLTLINPRRRTEAPDHA